MASQAEAVQTALLCALLLMSYYSDLKLPFPFASGSAVGQL